MNEQRILKLVDDAELIHKVYTDYEWFEGTKEDLIRFVELIIQDCLNITGQFEKSTIGASITEQIKEHFGLTR